MNLLSIFQDPDARRLAEQASRRQWAADAVHTALAHPAMARTRGLWEQRPQARSASMLAVVNIPRWPIPNGQQAAVRFLQLHKLAQGKPQWLGSKQDLPCPLSGVMPGDSMVYGIPQQPYLKILCLTPPGWADCYSLALELPPDHGTVPALECIERTMKRHGLPFKGIVFTPAQALDL